MKLVPSICPYCGTGCGMLLIVKDEKVVGVEPWERHPINEGKLCLKGWSAHQFVHHPGRLTSPLIRKNGELVEVSWDEALDFTADKLKGIVAEHGADAVGFLASAKCTNEENYVLQKFCRYLGSPNVDHCARL